MKKLSKTLLIFVTVLALLMPLSGCGGEGITKINEQKPNYIVTQKGEPASFDSIYFDFLGGSDVMPIGGFFGPYIPHTPTVNGQLLPDYLTDDIMSKIAESGVNMIMAGDTVRDSVAFKILELGQKYGVGFFVSDPYINNLVVNNTTAKYEDNFNTEYFARKMAEYAEYDSFLGIHTRDEPFTYHFSILKRIFEEFNALGYKNRYANLNMIGHMEASNVYTQWTTVMSGKDYLDQLVNATNLPVISWTTYPFDGGNPTEKTFKSHFAGLAKNWEFSRTYNKPWWRMMATGGQWNDEGTWKESAAEPYPSEGELNWDVNMALAYGAKGIQYFPLIQPEWFARATGGTYDVDRNSLIGADGSRTRWFYYAQKANNQIKAIDHILMNSANCGVIVNGNNAKAIAIGDGAAHEIIINSGSFRQLKSVSGGDAIIGCFDFMGGTALYAVNFSTSQKSNVTLNFDNNYGYDITQRTIVASVTGKSITLTLEAGEGALVVLR